MVAVDVITGPYDVPWVPKKGRTRPTETTYARWYSFSLIEVDLIVLHKPNTQILVKTRIMNLKGKLIVFSIFDSQSTVKILLYTAKIYFILIKKTYHHPEPKQPFEEPFEEPFEPKPPWQEE